MAHHKILAVRFVDFAVHSCNNQVITVEENRLLLLAMF